MSLLPVGTARADNYPVTTNSLYTATGIATRIENPKVRADLNPTPEQDKALKGRRLWTLCNDVHGAEMDKITGPDRSAKLRELFTQRPDEAFAAVGRGRESRLASLIRAWDDGRRDNDSRRGSGRRHGRRLPGTTGTGP